MTLLTAMVLMSATLWADETITVSANSTDISQALDLKVVANLFAEAQNLEEFETKLNDPNEFYNNLDLNGDGDVDYIRVVEVGEGNKRMIILQAILAKDIYQDIATIYVEKDASEQVSVQIIGDEYVYGTNYIIEPVYIYRPVIYDWFWGPGWYAWYSPWYWGYYPQRDPKLEYKLAGYEMFDDMTRNIEEDTVRLLFHVHIEERVEREQVAKVTGTNKDDSAPKAPIKRAEAKIYPNDPCPCGSGKKYKNCHGRA